MSADAINYIKKPTEDFLRDSWRLVKRCTKPDRNGAPAQSAAPTHGRAARGSGGLRKQQQEEHEILRQTHDHAPDPCLD